MAALVLKTSPGKIRLGFDSLALRFLNNNINEIAVSVIPTRTPVSKIHFSKEAAKSALGIVARDNKFNVGYRACGGEVYIIIDGKWVLAFHVSGSEIVEDL